MVEEGRAKVAGFLGADPSEIIFTSCGTEGDNAAILSALDVCPKRRRKIVISTVEHPAILNLGKDLERRGYTVVKIPVDSLGRLDMDRAREIIDEETAVVSVMWANNETGNLYPWKLSPNWRTAPGRSSTPTPSRPPERSRSSSAT